MKAAFPVLFATLLLQLPATAQERLVTRVESTPRGVRFTLELPAWELVPERTQAGVFHRIVVPRNVQRYVVPRRHDALASLPEAPFFNAAVALPLGARAVRWTVERSGATTRSDVRLYPTQPLAAGELGAFRFDEEVYRRHGSVAASKPPAPVTVTARETHVQAVGFPLVDYDPATRQLTSYRRLTITATVEEGGAPCYRRVREPDVAPPVGYAVLNPDAFRDFPCRDPQRPEHPGADLLVLVADGLADAADALATHKRTLGIATEVVPMSRVGSSSEQIERHVTVYFETAKRQPRWLLLLGDVGEIPTRYEAFRAPGESVLAAGDGAYGRLGEPPLALPRIAVGRVPAQTLGEAQAAVRKAIQHDLEAPTDADAYLRPAVAAYFNDANGDGRADPGAFAETAERRALAHVPLGYDPERLYRAPPLRVSTAARLWSDRSPIADPVGSATFDWTVDDTQVGAAIERGATVVLHRGHANEATWGTPGLTLTGGASLPAAPPGGARSLVMTFACSGALFDHETLNDHLMALDEDTPAKPYELAPIVVATGKGLAETLVLSPAGPIGVIGASRPSLNASNDVLMEEAVAALYRDPQASPAVAAGDLLVQAKAGFAARFLNAETAGSTQLQLTTYNLLGDPSAPVRIRAPR